VRRKTAGLLAGEQGGVAVNTVTSKPGSKAGQEHWSAVITSVKTPLAFIAFAVLILLTTLASSAMFMVQDDRRMILVYIMTATTIGSVVLVTVAAIFFPSALYAHPDATKKKEMNANDVATTGGELDEIVGDDARLAEDVNRLTDNERRVLRALADEPKGRLISSYRKYYSQELEFLSSSKGWLRKTDGRYRLTPSGKHATTVYLATLIKGYLKEKAEAG
jgi:hypothetical protein